jgi:triacylglycerol lipase
MTITLSFDNSATGYSYVNALTLAHCAKWAYLDADKAEATVRRELNINDFRFIDIPSTDTQAFIAGDKDKIIVSFRGTQPGKLKDILSDLKFGRIYGPLGKVHSGFLLSLSSAWREIAATIRQFQDSKQTLWFTGHSLGAALATLAVGKMVEFAYDVDGLYTFGQPRAGNHTFANAINEEMVAKQKKYFRFVNNNDVVPRVPLRSTGYADAGYFLYFDKKGVLYDDLSIWNRLLDGVHGRIDALGEKGTDGINDHNMDAYITLLLKNSNKTFGR